MVNPKFTSTLQSYLAWHALRLGMLVSVIVTVIAVWLWLPLTSPFESGELVVVTRQSPTTFYLDANGVPVGFEYDLAAEFARRQGLRLKLEIADSVSSLIQSVKGNQVHLAAGWLGVTSERAARVRFGPVYDQERELVICSPAIRQPGTLAGLAGLRLEVLRGSSHVERLLELRQAYPDLKWVEVDVISTEDLLERTASGLTDCTVADASTFNVVWHYWPNLKVAMALTEGREIAWVLPKGADLRLRQSLADFFREIRQDGWLDRLKERYFGHLRRLDEADVHGILGRRSGQFRALKSLFMQAQDETGLDWRLLAALAYQESQWNPLATSPTGVRGIMMLTTETADRLGVGNRLDPKESILAGARYLAMLRDQIPARIDEPDRTWMALAAYNLGLGHLEDARRLTQSLGKNPDVWNEVKNVLPMLAKSAYVNRLRLGYARGGEARALAENVRIYYDILKRFEPAYNGLRLAVGD